MNVVDIQSKHYTDIFPSTRHILANVRTEKTEISFEKEEKGRYGWSVFLHGEVWKLYCLKWGIFGENALIVPSILERRVIFYLPHETCYVVRPHTTHTLESLALSGNLSKETRENLIEEIIKAVKFYLDAESVAYAGPENTENSWPFMSERDIRRECLERVFPSNVLVDIDEIVTFKLYALAGRYKCSYFSLKLDNETEPYLNLSNVEEIPAEVTNYLKTASENIPSV